MGHQYVGVMREEITLGEEFGYMQKVGNQYMSEGWLEKSLRDKGNCHSKYPSVLLQKMEQAT